MRGNERDARPLHALPTSGSPLHYASGRRACASLLIVAAPLLALAACQQQARRSSRQRTGAQLRPRPEPVKGVDREPQGAGRAGGDVQRSRRQAETSLADFTGKPVLVNLWASWCAPCVKELPTLDKLARQQDGKLDVVAVSQDIGPACLGRGVPRAATGSRPRALPGPEDGAVGRARAGHGAADLDPVSMPTARKSGATSATSTGPARRRLSCLPKPARRETG